MKNRIKRTTSQILLIHVLRKKGSMSIAQLLRETEMKRATCVYYLNQLERDGLIKRERKEEGVTGRPTIITFDEEAYQRKREEFDERLKKREEEAFEEFFKHPLTKRMLELVKQNPKIDFNDLLNKEPIKNNYHKYDILRWLHDKGYIKESMFITKKGEGLLNRYDK